jgi:hypothetical protein
MLKRNIETDHNLTIIFASAFEHKQVTSNYSILHNILSSAYTYTYILWHWFTITITSCYLISPTHSLCFCKVSYSSVI